MSTRTYEEINNAVVHASKISDAVALDQCALELEELGTADAHALKAQACGVADRLRGDYPKAMEHFHQARALYNELGKLSGVASVTGGIAIIQSNTGNYAEALENHHRALAIYRDLGERDQVARVTGNIGVVYDQSGDGAKALEYYHRALALSEELGDTVGIAANTSNIGGIHMNTGNYPLALEHYHRALAMFEELGNQRSSANTLSGIGNLHASSGNLPLALEHYHRALELFDQLHDRVGVAQVTDHIGSVHGSMGDAALALAHFDRALALHREMGDSAGVARVRGNMIHALVETGSFAEAEILLATMDAMQIDMLQTVIQREMARASIQEHRGHQDEAKRTLQSVLNITQKNSLPLPEVYIHQQLRDLALKRNDLADYVEHNSQFTRITEEIRGREATAKLATKEAEAKMAKERAEHEKHLSILHSTLPKHIADRVARGETVNDHFDNAAVIFLDIVGFTTLSDQLSSTEVVQLLDTVFTTLDAVCKKHDVVKIKTIGDSYMAVAFPMESSSSEQRAASTALDMLHAISNILPDLPASLHADLPKGIEVRIGLHSGAVTAGVIGTERMQYDVWGDTVNVASRMENTSEPGKIHVSEAVANALNLRLQDPRLQDLRQGDIDVIPSASEEQGLRGGTSSPFPVPCSLIERGALEIKGKGTMTTYWLEAP